MIENLYAVLKRGKYSLEISFEYEAGSWLWIESIDLVFRGVKRTIQNWENHDSELISELELIGREKSLAEYENKLEHQRWLISL